MRLASGLCALAFFFTFWAEKQPAFVPSAAPRELRRGESASQQLRILPTDSKTLELHIFADTIPAANLDNGTRIRAHRALLRQAEQQWDLSDPPRLQGGTMPERLALRVAEEGGEKEVPLPPLIEKNLLSYLTFGPASQPFDCGSFVHFLRGFPYVPGEFERVLWEVKLLRSEPALAAGTVVAISDSMRADRNSIVHFALALGDGLYLSKFGTRGSLIVTDLESLQHTFEGEYVFSLEPAV